MTTMLGPEQTLSKPGSDHRTSSYPCADTEQLNWRTHCTQTSTCPFQLKTFEFLSQVFGHSWPEFKPRQLSVLYQTLFSWGLAVCRGPKEHGVISPISTLCSTLPSKSTSRVLSFQLLGGMVRWLGGWEYLLCKHADLSSITAQGVGVDQGMTTVHL